LREAHRVPAGSKFAKKLGCAGSHTGNPALHRGVRVTHLAGDILIVLGLVAGIMALSVLR
jgi:hypothetical protein